MSLLDNIIKLLEKVFFDQWIAAVVGGGGIVLAFAGCLIVGLCSGDFVRSKRAIKRIAAGSVEDGLLRLKRFAPEYDKRREISPPATEFDYNKIIAYPYSYSLIKKLPSITLASTAFFSMLSFSASVIIEGNVTHYSTFMLIFLPLLGTTLYIISLILAGVVLKKATNLYHDMIELIKDITVRPAGEVVLEDALPPQQVIDVCKKIELLAVNGGAGYPELSQLYDEINLLKDTYLDHDSQGSLNAALEVLSALIDSAM